MSVFSDIDEPSWAEILRGVQDSLAARIHTSLPGIVKAYDASTQTATIQLAVQLRGHSVPPLADVPVAWPGGAAGFFHAPLAAGDTVLVVFTEEDFSAWSASGSVSAPAVLARHGLHAVAIPGLRRPGAALAVTGGHVTVGAASEVRLGSDGASDPVALKSLVEGAVKDLLNGIISAAGSVTAPGGGPAFVAALNLFKTSYELALQVGADKVKAT
ncbi:MAG: Gp138 family membrane-puncturing spike protein [Pseudomonadota bacterium]